MFGLFKRNDHAEWLSKAEQEVEFTPDNWKLESSEFQNVFLYNECMLNFPQYDLIKEHSALYGTAFTLPEYSLWKKLLGKHSFAIACEAANKLQPLLRIKGQIHTVYSYRIKELDKYMSNTVYSDRKRVFVDIPHTRIKKDGTQLNLIVRKPVWMYVGRQTIEELAPRYSYQYVYYPVRTFNNTNRLNAEYYCFTKQEYRQSHE